MIDFYKLENECSKSLNERDIDQFEDQIYSDLYDALLSIPYQFKRMFVFNLSETICSILESSKKPEVDAETIFYGYVDYLSSTGCWSEFGDFEKNSKEGASIVFSCVYVILFHSKPTNERIPRCLIRIKAIVKPEIFKLFEGLLKKKKSNAKEKTETTETKQMPTKYDIFIKEVDQYNFSKIPKLEGIAENKIKELITKIVESIPCGVAMLEYLEYREYLKKNYQSMQSREDQYKHIAKAFQVNKDTIKGNVLVYENPKIKKALNYSAYQFKENVEKYFKELLNK